MAKPPLQPGWQMGSSGGGGSASSAGGGSGGAGGSAGSGGGGGGSGGNGSGGGNVAGGPAAGGAAAGGAAGKVLTEAEAQTAFDELAAHKEIPFDYPPDCCYARASEMGDLLAAKGVEAKKVWTYGNLVPMAGANPVRFPPVSGQQVIWRYHVAPTVPVRRASGAIDDMVMDPSLSKTPLTIAQWNDLMRGPGSSLTQTAQSARDVFYRAPDGTEYIETDTVERDAALELHRRTRDAALGRP